MRVTAAHERTQTAVPSTTRFVFADFVLDPDRAQLQLGDHVLPLGRPTLLVLERLLRARGAVVSQGDLLAAGWPDVAVNEGSLRQAIYDLRRALRPGFRAAPLQSVRGEGYRFVAHVDEVPGERHEHALVRAVGIRERPPTVVGRADELTLLRHALDEAASGIGKTLMLVGAAGVGKTHLAQQLVRDARAHAVLALTARAEPDRGAPPLWPWTSLIRRCIDAVSPELRAACEQSASQALAMLRAPAASGETPESQRFFLFEELAGFFTRTAARVPLLLVFDDLHAADELSQAFFVRLAREVVTSRMLIVATCRSLEGPLAPMLEGLDHHVAPLRIDVANLTCEQLDQLFTLRSMPMAKERLAQVHALTRGNPLFAVEVANWQLRERSTQAPPSGALELRTVILRRIACRSGDARAVLSVASVLGEEFSATELCAITDVASGAAAAGLDEACDAELLEPARESGRYRFVHPMLREAVYHDLTLETRRGLHARVAAWLDGRGPGVVVTRIHELAFHLYSASNGRLASRAADCLAQAAERAYQTTAFAAAAESYQRALQMLELLRPPEPERELRLRLRQAEALRATGCPRERLHAIFVSVSEQAEALGHNELLARAALGYAGQSPEHFSLARVPNELDPVERTLLHKALSALGEELPELRALLLSAQSLALTYTHEVERCRASIADARSLAASLDRPALLARVLTVRIFVEGAPGRELAQRGACDELVALAEQHGLNSVLVDALVGRAMVHYAHADGQLAEADFRRARRVASSLACPDALNRARVHELFEALLTGRLAAFELLAGQLFQAAGDVLRARVLFATRMLVLQYLRYAETRQKLAIEPAIQGTFAPSLGLLCMLSAGYAERGERALAEQIFDFAAADDFTALPASPTWLAELTSLGVAANKLDDSQRAARVYRRLLPFSERMLVYGFEALPGGPVACTLAMLAATIGEFDEAERWFELSLALCRKLNAPLYEHLTISEYILVLERRGSLADREKAHALVRQLSEFGRAHGIGLLRARAAAAERSRDRATSVRKLRASS